MITRASCLCVSQVNLRPFVGIFPFFQNRPFRRSGLSIDIGKKIPFSLILNIEITALPTYN